MCRQAAALLQLLNAMAGGRDVGTAVTITCQTIIKGTGLGSRAPLVKRLAYNIVKGAALTDSDWDNVLSGFQNDISPASPSTEVCCYHMTSLLRKTYQNVACKSCSQSLRSVAIVNVQIVILS